MSTPIGPYAPIVRAGSWLVCSGQLGLVPAGDAPAAGTDPPAPRLVDGGVVPQLVQAIDNAEQLLHREGATLRDVVKVTIFLVDMADYSSVNAAYADRLGDHRPARSVIAVAGLPMAAQIEVEFWAYENGG